MKRIFLKIYRLFVLVSILVLLFWLCQKNVVTGGKLFIERDFCNQSRFISNFYPEERVGETEKERGECFQKVFVEPAYFKIKIPRTFERAKIRIFFQNFDQENLQLGLIKKREFPLDWRFTLKPLENKTLDYLNWFRLSEQGITLWQKEKEFDRIYDFVNNLPKDKKIGTFFYDFSPEIKNGFDNIKKWNLQDSINNFDYLIADYQSPQQENNWKMSEIDFLVGKEYLNEHALEFMISAPGLTDHRYEIKIKKIEVELIRPEANWQSFIFDLKDYLLRKIQNVKEKIS